MTIKEKVKHAIERHRDMKLQGVLIDVIAEEILALIKPMSRERLMEIIENSRRRTSDGSMVGELFANRIADALLELINGKEA